MRANKYGVRGLKGVQLKKGLVYFWTPPVSLQKAGIFKHKTLGTDFEIAIAKAQDWNARLEAYRLAINGTKPTLGTVNPMTVGYLVRQFEASPKFARYSAITRQDYSNIYRNVETQLVDGQRMFGDVKISDVTRQLAYSVYKQNIMDHGHDSANKTMTCRFRKLRPPEWRLFPNQNIIPINDRNRLPFRPHGVRLLQVATAA